MPVVADLVRLSKLDTQFHAEYTEHIQEVSASASERRKLRKEERWRIEKLLGGGSFGVVSLERCIMGDSEGKKRAVKKIRKLDQNNYHRELEAIALFSHRKYEQCFVKSFGWYDDDDSIYITMEYLPNGDLQKYLNSPLPENDGQIIVSQVLEGLEYMHKHGFTHRDLKPANILVVRKQPEWWVKIADFGISKRTVEDLTSLRTAVGTPAFAAPEVLGYTQSDSYKNSVDMWSLGLITFLILTGETIFKDQRRLRDYVAGTYKFPSDTLRANKVSQEGYQFIESLLAIKPEDRPAAVESLQNPWLINLAESAASQTERTMNTAKLPESQSLNPDIRALASTSWSTNPFRNRTLDTSKLPGNQTLKPDVRESYGEIELSPPPPRSRTRELPPDIPYPQERRLSPSQNSHPPDLPYPSSSIPCDKSRELSPITTMVKSMSQTSIQIPVLTARAPLWNDLGDIGNIAFSLDGKLIAFNSRRGVKVLDTATSSVLTTSSVISTLFAGSELIITFSPNNKLLALSYMEGWSLWEINADSVHMLDTKLVYGRKNMSFSPNSKLVTWASSATIVKLWDLAKGSAHEIHTGHADTVLDVLFSPNGELLASMSADGIIIIWDLALRAPRAKIRGALNGPGTIWSKTNLSFSPDGRLILSAPDWQNRVSLWDSETGTSRGVFPADSDNNEVVKATFSPDGTLVASAQGNMIRLWETIAKRVYGELVQFENIALMEFSPNSKLVVAGTFRAIRLWDLNTKTICYEFKFNGMLKAIAFSPNSKLFVLETGYKIFFWDVNI